jgi:hypothetical protein
MEMTAEQSWRLLTNNYEAGSRPEVRLHGDPQIVSTPVSTHSIIGTPK